jgi:opacity protein-like surface antigen
VYSRATLIICQRIESQGNQWSPVDGASEVTPDMFKRLAAIAVSALVAASFGIPAASAQNDGTFTLTVNKAAYSGDQIRSNITMTGTYKCSPAFIPDNSGINVQVTQIQRGNLSVSGGGGTFVSLTCDGSLQTWTVPNIGANFGFGPATWKTGKAIAIVQGFAAAGNCMDPNNPCSNISAQVGAAITIH